MKFIAKIFLLCLLLEPFGAFAQQMLRGIVRDQNGTMPGVTIVLQNKDKRVIAGKTTNENGEYFLTIPAGAEGLDLVFSFVGMKSKIIKYTGQKVLNVTLEEEITALDEVVIQAKRTNTDNMGINADNLGVARQKLDLAEFQDMTVTSVEDMLQGKLTNVDIIASSGDPGAKSSIRIRGTSSLNASNEPLIVIDDVPVMDQEIGEDFDFGTADVEDFGALVNISPSDIESIEVLKDAAATALYGSQAANGVLLIKTKRGQIGKPSFRITQKFTYSWEPKTIPMLNAAEYVTLMQDALWNAAAYDGFQPQDVKKLTQYRDILYDVTNPYFDEFNQETDWLSLVVNNPLSSTTDFAMNGGGARATYNFSLSYTKENGTTIGSDFKRITARLNLDYNLSTRLKVASSFSYAEGLRNNPSGTAGTPRDIAFKKMPNMSPWIIDDVTGLPTDQYFLSPDNSDRIQNLVNPVAMVHLSNSKNLNRAVNAQFSMNYNIFNGLVANAIVAFKLSTDKNNSFVPAEAMGVAWTNSQYNLASEGSSNSASVYAKLLLRYARTWGKHYVALSSAIETNEGNSSSYSSSVYGIGTGELGDPSAGGVPKSLTSGRSQSRSVGIMGRLAYEYDNRYNISVAVRSDATSKTGRNCRWGTFPTVSGQWRLNNEPFLKEYDWLSDFRLSASWGKSGRAPSGGFTYVGTMNAEDDYMDMTAIKPNSMQLNNLKWEVKTSYNFGLKLAFLNDRFTLDVDYYNQRSRDLLQSNMGIPSTSGYAKVGYFNSGSLENRGWEVAVNLKNIVNIRGFKVSISNLNIARNRNRIKELPINMTEEDVKNANGAYASKYLVDQPLGSFYGYRCLGVYQNDNETYARDDAGNIIRDVKGEPVITSIFGTKDVRPGDAKYYDTNHDGVINKYDMVYLGNAMPIMTGGGAIRFEYKDLSLRASFHFRVGQKVINQTRMDAESMYNGNNQRRSVLRRWRYEGDDTNIPRALFGKGYNYLGSDRFVEDNSFLKCKDLTLTYKLPRTFVKNLGFSNISAYITTYNLFTITKYTGQDPETSIPSGTSQLAKDTSLTPRARKVALGLTLNF